MMPRTHTSAIAGVKISTGCEPRARSTHGLRESPLPFPDDRRKISAIGIVLPSRRSRRLRARPSPTDRLDRGIRRRLRHLPPFTSSISRWTWAIGVSCRIAVPQIEDVRSPANASRIVAAALSTLGATSPTMPEDRGSPAPADRWELFVVQDRIYCFIDPERVDFRSRA